MTREQAQREYTRMLRLMVDNLYKQRKRPKLRLVWDRSKECPTNKSS